MLGDKIIFLLQPVELWKSPSWERIFQSMTLYNTQTTTEKCFFRWLS